MTLDELEAADLDGASSLWAHPAWFLRHRLGHVSILHKTRQTLWIVTYGTNSFVVQAATPDRAIARVRTVKGAPSGPDRHNATNGPTRRRGPMTARPATQPLLDRWEAVKHQTLDQARIDPQKPTPPPTQTSLI